MLKTPVVKFLYSSGGITGYSYNVGGWIPSFLAEPLGILLPNSLATQPVQIKKMGDPEDVPHYRPRVSLALI